MLPPPVKMANLSVHDNSILKALFDPEASPAGAVQIDKTRTPLPRISTADFAAIQSKEQEIVRRLDVASPSADTIRAVSQDLTRLISQHPHYASAYVNRAQAVRLLLPTADIFTLGCREESERLMQDLGRSIDLASSPGSPSPPQQQQQSVSAHQAQVLAAAHTHRGFLLLRVADLKRRGVAVQGVVEGLARADAEQVEEMASRDFAAGARFGNKTAQQMSVRTNPYAKMCGAIVKEALRKEVDEGRARIQPVCL